MLNNPLKKEFPIVCLSGSTKFKDIWIEETRRLTLEGNLVLGVGLYGHHEGKFPEPKVKQMLDDMHRQRIRMADWIYVLDVCGYIGESTKAEIAYALALSKPVRYFSKDRTGRYFL